MWHGEWFMNDDQAIGAGDPRQARQSETAEQRVFHTNLASICHNHFTTPLDGIANQMLPV
jgi:hypothetical protein